MLLTLGALLSIALYAEGSRRFPLPEEGLPLMDVPPHEVLTKEMPQKVEVLLPSNLRLQKITSPLDLDLTIMAHSGQAFLMGPKQGKLALTQGLIKLKAWDRLITEDKSEIKMTSRDGHHWILGSNGLLQVLKKDDGSTLMRLLKGRLRVQNVSEEHDLEVETLNSTIVLPSGTTDIIISAMNTLVAPREGKDVVVTTRKTKALVSVGKYGFIDHDGTLLYSEGK